MKQKAYTILMALLLTSIGIKYEGSNNNPFQHASPSKMIFVTAICCHVLVSTVEMSLPTTIFIFHLSGIVGCEVLMWILVDEFAWWYVTNVLLLLVASFCFNNCKHIIDLIGGTRSNAPNLEAQEGQM
ncbi:hypothetical protein PHAVU_004G101100 [Phaseolus vulgaris]|uniref:Uncharacterized protein n=1 Tax=Phaseolus vulgaris TaxID=3885 RepID=V7C1M6_PHAVU|nr:hypothetical protein PHAVU_004G101100g [Phaseolus vulgaris]ESW24082.1 hypothetical protein PHAVU_004G101100g [Phaseolus vulgaris]